MFPGNKRASSTLLSTPMGSRRVAGASPKATTGTLRPIGSTPAGVEAATRSGSVRAGLPRLALAALLLLTLAACRQKMANQPSYNPYEASDFFADGMSARPRIDGTVARGELSNNPFMDSGRINGQLGDGFPMPVTTELVDRGESRFDIYCSECHGRLGDGKGMIPLRGYRRPPSFHIERLRTAPTGHFFDVMTNGFGVMPSYRTMIPTRDRWAIVAYIRALQLSQSVAATDIPPAERAKLDAPPADSGAAGHGASEGGHH